MLHRLFTSPEYVLRPQNVLRRLILRARYARHQAVVALPFGAKILVEEGDYIGNHIINTRCYDAALSEMIWRLIQPGDVCVDVGANIGYITLLMAVRCSPGGRCISFEADPVIYEKAVQNVGRNQLEPVVKLYNLAASDAKQSLTFQSATGKNCGLGHVVKVEGPGAKATGLITIDAVALDECLGAYSKIHVAKLDVEGHELRVLMGMNRMLRECRVENIFFENHEREKSPIFSMLAGFGYKIFQVTKRFAGPALEPASTPMQNSSEPNYVATVEPDQLGALVRGKGWHVF